MAESLVIVAENGETEGVHPDTLGKDDFPEFTSVYRVIRAKCLDCAHTESEVRKCVATDCPLWPFRMGRKPKALRKKVTNSNLRKSNG